MSLSEYTKLNKAIVDNNKELLSIQQEAEQSEYNTDWNPYDDEDFHIEDYENYDDDDDDVIRGY